MRGDKAVFTHLDITGHSFKTDNVVILSHEEDWFLRVSKKPFGNGGRTLPLTRGGGLRFQLSHVWNSAIKTMPCRFSAGNPSGRQVDMHDHAC